MSSTSEILFEYLRDILYNPSKAMLDISKLDEDFVMLGKGLIYFAQCFCQYNEFASSLARGDLSAPPPPPENELAAPLKSLHASLKHLTWQSKQVAIGDYSQRVDFMGEFATAFNRMVEQLADRQQNLEAEIELNRKKALALEQSNELLTNITRHIPQQIIVISKDTREILLINEVVRNEVAKDAEYIEKLINIISESDYPETKNHIEIQYTCGGEERYLSVSSYLLDWHSSNAEAFVINDISIEKNKVKELEIYAYRDTMTNLYNRFYGMLTLNRWLDQKKQFALIFADLDNLKYINDTYGHNEGDVYITSSAKHLKTFHPDAVVCRIGGDEFMLLVPDIIYDEAHICMSEICQKIQNDEYIKDKEYIYSVSFGIVTVEKDSTLTASEILSIADERMYEHKRMRKKSRQDQNRM